VLIAIKSTPRKKSRAMRETALLPPPPTPITLTLADKGWNWPSLFVLTYEVRLAFARREFLFLDMDLLLNLFPYSNRNRFVYNCARKVDRNAPVGLSLASAGPKARAGRRAMTILSSIILAVIVAATVFAAIIIRRRAKVRRIRTRREIVQSFIEEVWLATRDSPFNERAVRCEIAAFVECPELRVEPCIAQRLVDLALRRYAVALNAACQEQESFRRYMDAERKKALGKWSRSEIEGFKNQESTIEEKVKEAKGKFWGFHTTASTLGFKVWASHRDYLLLM
jgi:hypothetical protein